MHATCSWVIFGISFYAVLKLFKASAYRYPSAITASFLEQLLTAGLPGQVGQDGRNFKLSEF
jgi:phosphoglycerol transferase MdoB-like AlkP superfamily enzyme